MNQEIKKQWVEALRSGEFKQGKNALCRKGKFCCLGVLSELGYRAGVVSKDPDPDYCGDIHYGEDSVDVALPIEVMDWAGLDRDNPVVDNKDLASLNDGGAPFEAIADLIDVHL